MKRILQRLVPSLAIVLLLAACGAPSQRTAPSDVTGLYSLESVDGAKVPAKVRHGGAELEIRSGAFRINADGTCSSQTVFVPPSGREVTREVKATYRRAGQKLTMRWKGAGMTTGQVDGDTFTMNNEGMVLSYRK